MKRHLFKLFLLVGLCFILILSACSSGSGSGSNNTATDSASVAKEKPVVNPAGVFPIVEDKITLTVLVPQNAQVEDFSTNEFTKWLEDKTNIAIEWEVVPSQGAQEALNLRLASGDLPDIIMNFGVTPAVQMIYGQQGVFLPLNDLIKNYGKYIFDVFAEDPLAESILTSPNGMIYSMPNTSDCFHCKFAQKMWIYQPWLDELGLAIPETTDEFYTVLKAFKTKYPNSEPFASTDLGWNTKMDGYLMSAFIPNNGLINRYKLLKNGKIDVIFNKPEWRQGLEYLHKLYAEGLIAPETFTQDGTQLKNMGESEVPILGSFTAGHQGAAAQLSGESGRWLEYLTVPPLKGPGGLQVSAYNPFISIGGKLVINGKTKHPEAAFRWADAFYESEIFMRQKYGRPDMEYEKPKAGMIGINGLPATWNSLVPYGQLQNNHWGQSAPILETDAFRLGQAVLGDPNMSLEPILYRESLKYKPYAMDINSIVPPLFYTEEQTAEIVDLEKTIIEYVEEMFARFVTGDIKMNDAEWNKYTSTLDKMNLKRFIELNQEAYESKYKQ